MPKISDVLDNLASAFEDMADKMREARNNLAYNQQEPEVAHGGQVGEGEEVYDEEDVDYPAAPQPQLNVVGLDERRGIHDDTQVTIKSGDLRRVVNAYRKLVRFARNGIIPGQDERMDGHKAVYAVKHLIRKPQKEGWPAGLYGDRPKAGGPSLKASERRAARYN